ncbi:MAG: hypothetical protein CSA84_04920 [Actinomycetales bacterium]|nr:MAG: hypothetical protein CSA84_04920 [Actinomycetales bacterium]
MSKGFAGLCQRPCPNSIESMTSTVPSRVDSNCPPKEPEKHSRSLTAWCVRRKWWVLLVSTVLLGGSVALLGSGIATTPDEEELVGDSARAAAIHAAADFGTHPTEQIIATAAEPLTPEAAVALGWQLAPAYKGIDGVVRVGEPFPGADGRSVVLSVALDAARSEADTSLPQPAEVVEPVLEATSRLQAEHPELMIGQVGPGSLDREVNDTIARDFQKAELVSLPVTLIILLVAFGAVLAAGVPLVLGIGSVAVALGLTAAVSHNVIAVDPNIQSLVLLIGLAVGVDYALFVLRRAATSRRANRLGCHCCA